MSVGLNRTMAWTERYATLWQKYTVVPVTFEKKKRFCALKHKSKVTGIPMCYVAHFGNEYLENNGFILDIRSKWIDRLAAAVRQLPNML